MSFNYEQLDKSSLKPLFVENLAVYAVGCLTFSVSLGVALVSISSLLVVIASIALFIVNRDKNLNQLAAAPLFFIRGKVFTVWAIFLGLAWEVLSIAWSIADWHQIGLELTRSSRLLVIPFVLYLIRTPKQALSVLNIWVYGQIFVILSSYALWLGFSEPWATSSDAVEYYTPYTTTLDQPIMNSVAFAVIWFFRGHFSSVWGSLLMIKNKTIANVTVYLLLLLIFVNVCFLMIGRSGMLSMIIVISLVVWLSVSRRLKLFAVFLPFMLFAALFFGSPKFHDRIEKIPEEIADYQRGKIETSQAIRLEFWHRSIQAIEDKPLLGFGVGSWPTAYIFELKGEEGIQADSPHQQFLLWWVEGGTIGFVFLMAIYFSIFRDALKLESRAKNALICLFSVLFFSSLMNCPLQGAGISEFFCVGIGLLLVFVKNNSLKG